MSIVGTSATLGIQFKCIVLAGGSGTHLQLATPAISKQLLPVYATPSLTAKDHAGIQLPSAAVFS